MKRWPNNKLGTPFMTVAVAIVFVAAAGTVFGAYPVMVTNFQATLMPLLQKYVTAPVQQQMQKVWSDEVQLKKEPGLIDSSKVTIADYDNSPYLNNMFDSQFPKYFGSYAQDRSGWEMAAKASTMPKIPSTDLSFSQYQSATRVGSVLIAGPPEKTTAGMGSAQTADAKLRDLRRQANIASYEQSNEGVYIAERYRKELSAFSPSSFDGPTVKSDQAVKDMAKLMYYNAMLQAETLQVLARGEVKNVLGNR
jgi:hypothetical protein